MYVQCRRDPPLGGSVPSALGKSPDWFTSWGGGALPAQIGNVYGIQQHHKDQDHINIKDMGKQGGGGPHAAASLVKEMSEGGGKMFPKTPKGCLRHLKSSIFLV
jgi:hypothetical protein